jgi:glycosyltransferase involved in cell wall biosynthesis
MNYKRKPLVTIGIPTYNRADGYLRDAISSTLAQTYENVEIVVSDNCSTDGTELVLKSYADARIRYFRQEKQISANENFNFCLQQAKGSYFLLLHDDDMIDEKFIESCMTAVDLQPDIGLIRTGVRVMDQNGKVIAEKENTLGGLSTEDFLLAWLDREMPMLLCASLFNTKGLREEGGFNSKHQLFQDVLAEFQVAARYGRMDVREVRATFRRHPGQRTHLKSLRHWCEDSLFLMDRMCSLAEGKRDMIIHKGLQFFAEHNYDIASQIKSPIKRSFAYLLVYRFFKYRYSPLRFYYRRKFSKRFNKISKKIINKLSDIN